MPGLSDRVTLVCDLLVTAKRSHIAESAHGIAGKLPFDGEVEVLRIRDSEMRAVQTDADRLKGSKIHRLASSRKREWKLICKRLASVNVYIRICKRGRVTGGEVVCASRTQSEWRRSQVLQRSLLFGAVKVDPVTAANRQLMGVTTGEEA